MTISTHLLSTRFRIPGWVYATLRAFLMISMPVFLVLTSVQVVATEAFLRFEYNRADFPEDRYGFTTKDRLEYGPYAVKYMKNDEDISYLGDLKSPDGKSPLYKPGELKHMEDVKAVSTTAFRLHLVLSVALGVIALASLWTSTARRALRRGLRDGGLFTLMLIVTLVVLVVLSWDFFFDGFHDVFFDPGTWRFKTSDTLIRLYPERFWFDAAMTIGALTISGALLAVFSGWYWERRADQRTHSTPTQNGAADDPVA
ncbi:MAG: TIGR01906 family membrane protein [Chloroflexi bacterium]|nr:TIGR01906 family membrane protein [Chloroflexota bacterium]